jgi:hypothetical protein
MEIEIMDKSLGSVSIVRKKRGFIVSKLDMVILDIRNDSSRSKTHLVSSTCTP